MAHISSLLNRAKNADALATKLQKAYESMLSSTEKQEKLAVIGLTPDNVLDASRAIQDLSDLIEEIIGNIEIQWPPRYAPPKNN